MAVLKSVVTQASLCHSRDAAYISMAFKIMKEKGIHEGCMEQVDRMMRTRLYGADMALDEQARIRMDDWELRETCSRPAVISGPPSPPRTSRS